MSDPAEPFVSPPMSSVADVAEELQGGATEAGVAPPPRQIRWICGLPERDGVDPVWLAVERMLPPTLPDAFVLGITGGSVRRANAPLLHSDLLHWLFPGLAMCGIEAALMPLPETAEACQAMLRQQIQHRGGVCLFAFSSDINLIPFSNPAISELSGALDIQEPDPAITEMAFATALPASSGKSQRVDTLALADTNGTVTTLDTANIGALRSRFSHALTLHKGARRPVKALALEHAVRAWAQFACACPYRTIGIGLADAPLRALAAAFWRQMAGAGRSARSNRLRRLADLLANPQDKRDLDAAFRSLYEMACDSLLLPPYLANALLAPATAVLSDAERRELIYLARAGTRDLKIFAAHRLTFERECADARATLNQLRYDPDAWVRGAAQD